LKNEKMKTEQNNQSNELNESNMQIKPKKTIAKKIWVVTKKNPFTTILLIVLIAFISWSTIKMNYDKYQFEKDKIQIIENYTSKIDSIKLNNIQFSSTVFSWSVRSELIRQNMENLNQLFTYYVKNSSVNLVQLVDLKENKIIISTNKQFEGELFTLTTSVNLNKQTTVITDSKTIIYTPIMGFNDAIGLLIVSVDK